jgi:prepilin-type N-terminal cleavage/methylation domain-containing protein
MIERKTQGFTLIELVVTLFVLSLAASVVAPSVVSGVGTLRARAETAGIASFLRAAREQAVTHNRTYEVRVKSEEGIVELRTGNTVPATRRLAPGLRVTADPREAQIITFLPQGLSSGSRLHVEMAGRGYLITVDPLTGRVATRRVDQ